MGENIVVVGHGGSPSAGHSVGKENVYSVQFVKNLNEKYRSNNESDGKFVLQNFGAGAKNTFFNAMVTPAIVPLNTSIILWEFGINDDFYAYSTGRTKNESIQAIELWIHNVLQICPNVIFGFAFLWGHSPPSDRFFRERLEPVLAHYSSHGLPLFFLNFGGLYNVTNFDKKLMLADAFHPTKEAHKMLGDRFFQSFQKFEQTSSNSQLTKKKIIPMISPNENSHSLYDFIMNSHGHQAIMMDLPTLTNIENFDLHQKLKTKFNPLYNDKKRELKIPICAHGSKTFTFDYNEETKCVLIGVDFQNLRHNMTSYGTKLTEEEYALSIYTKAYWGYRWKGEWYVFNKTKEKKKIEITFCGISENNGLTSLVLFERKRCT